MLRRGNNPNLSSHSSSKGGGGGGGGTTTAGGPRSSTSSSPLAIASGRPTASSSTSSTSAMNTCLWQALQQQRGGPKARLYRLLGFCAVVVVTILVFFSDSFMLQRTIALAWQPPPPGPLHFCQVPTIETIGEDQNPLDVAHQCHGPEYDTMTTALHAFADNVQVHERTWGRRLTGMPPNSRVLMLGNEDTVQIAYALACQYAAQVEQVHDTVQAIHFPTVNATLVLITDAGEHLRNVTTTALPQFGTAIAAETNMALTSFDAMVWGLLHNCGAVAAACPNTTQPLYFAAAQQFHGPMLFIGMMADARSEQSLAIRDEIRNTKSKGPRKLWFISGRRYISQVRLEGATIYGQGDADNAPKTGKIGHRCTGANGGHADLLAFDVTEFLHQQLGAPTSL